VDGNLSFDLSFYRVPDRFHQILYANLIKQYAGFPVFAEKYWQILTISIGLGEISQI
jgi:hypothetical protein